MPDLPTRSAERTSGLKREKDRGVPIHAIIGLRIHDAAAHIAEQMPMIGWTTREGPQMNDSLSGETALTNEIPDHELGRACCCNAAVVSTLIVSSYCLTCVRDGAHSEHSILARLLS